MRHTTFPLGFCLIRVEHNTYGRTYVHMYMYVQSKKNGYIKAPWRFVTQRYILLHV